MPAIERNKFGEIQYLIPMDKDLPKEKELGSEPNSQSKNVETSIKTIPKVAQTATPEYDEFPVHCFPENMRNMIVESAESLRLPVVVSGTSVLAALSTAVSKNLRVISGHGMTACGVLCIIPAMESGLGKSALSQIVLGPIKNIEEELFDKWEMDTKAEGEAELDSIKAQMSTIRKAISEAKSASDIQEIEKLTFELKDLYKQKRKAERKEIPPTLKTDDCTQQEVARLLATNNCMISSISSEAGEAIQTLLGKWNPATKTEDTLFLKGYSLEDHPFGRSTTESFTLRECAINILWLVQPRYIEDMFSSSSLLNGGFLARCLICDTHAEPQEQTGNERPIREQTRRLYTEDLLDIFNEFRCREAEKNALGKYEVQPSIICAEPSVAVLMRDYYNHWVRLRKGDLRDIQQFLARWAENAWRIAVCLHAAKYVANAGSRTLELETAKNAIEIMDWFSNQIISLMHMGREQHADGELTRLLNYLKAKGGEEKCLTMRLLKKVRFTPQIVESLAKSNPNKIKIKEVRPPKGGPLSTMVYAI